MRVVYYALRGLNVTGDQVHLQAEGDNYLLVDSADNVLRYKVLDAYGKPKTKMPTIEKVTLFQMDDKTKKEDITPKASIEGNTIVVKFGNIVDMKWAAHAIKFQLRSTEYPKAELHVVKTFVIKAQIYEQVATSFAQTAGWDYPEKYQVSSGFPVQFNQLNSNKYPIVHIQLDAQFFGDADKTEYPQSLFVTLQKDDQIPYTAHADYIKSI